MLDPDRPLSRYEVAMGIFVLLFAAFIVLCLVSDEAVEMFEDVIHTVERTLE